MIISRTPYRISFFGGGTDYPGWYRQHGGAVLATTIDKYCYLTCRYLPPFFEHRFRIVWSKIECCQEASEISHPAVRELLAHLNITRNLEIHHEGDLPARSGMGSSSAFTVGLLCALRALEGKISGRYQLATESIYLEQEVLKETVGSQDQVLAAYGGLNYVRFNRSGAIDVRPVTISAQRRHELEQHVMLFYTGIRRTAEAVARTYVNDLARREKQLHRMRELVDEASEVLGSAGDLRSFGELLHEGWQMKRSLSPHVSNPSIDAIYESARSAGAVGGKVTGAGGGGFVLLFVPPDAQKLVREALKDLIHVPIKFGHRGSQIIFMDQESGDYVDEEQYRNGQKLSSFREAIVPAEVSTPCK